MSKSLNPSSPSGVTTLLLLGFGLACSSATPQGQTTDGAGAKGGNGGSSAPGGDATPSGGGMSPTGGSASANTCDTPGLTWKTARKTWYESYPDPGSEECVKYNGCKWAGQFAACEGKKPEAWVEQHNIVAVFPGFSALTLHDLCLKSGDKTLVVTVLDTCGDEDCDGCCTQNRADADALIDLEKYTNERWGVPDGAIQWADLGPTRGTGCR